MIERPVYIKLQIQLWLAEIRWTFNKKNSISLFKKTADTSTPNVGAAQYNVYVGTPYHVMIERPVC